jgi:hypothetical protein
MSNYRPLFKEMKKLGISDTDTDAISKLAVKYKHVREASKNPGSGLILNIRDVKKLENGKVHFIDSKKSAADKISGILFDLSLEHDRFLTGHCTKSQYLKAQKTGTEAIVKLNEEKAKKNKK